MDIAAVGGILLCMYVLCCPGGDTYQEGLAYYRLGGAHEKGGNVDAGLKCYRNYFERCKHHGDHQGMGQACQALANTYER